MLLLKKFLKKFEKIAIKIEKRLRLVLAVFILSLFLLFSTFFYFDKALIFIQSIIALSYFLSYFALLEDIKKFDWFGLFFVPVILTLSFYLFYFLFPARWLTRIPFILVYGVSLYAVLLCSNIFNIGVEKSLGLYRAAFSINYFYLTLIAFILSQILFSFRLNFLINGVFSFGVGFLLSLHLYWTIKLKKSLEEEVIKMAVLTGLILMETAIFLSFVPFKINIIALVLATSFYSLAGIIYNFLDDKLFKETVREYLIVWGVIIFISLLTLR